MTVGTFKRIIDQTSQYLEFAYLHFAGEPLMHPQLGKLIDYASSQGIKTGISTNGTLLDREKAELLINSQLGVLIISIDATDSNTYYKITGSDSFHIVVKNIKQFLELKVKMGRGPHTVLQMVPINENKHQTKQFVRNWKVAGVDAIRLKRFFNWAGTVENRSYNQSKPVQLNGKNNGGLEKKTAPVPYQKPRPVCFLLWRQIVFYFDGTAVSCCNDQFHKSVLGNIHKQTLDEIWNSPTMLHMRQMHIEGRQDEIPLCAACNQPDLSIPQLLCITALSAFATKKILITIERLTRLAGLTTPY